MDLIRDNLRYDEETGGLVWARTRGFIRAGTRAGGMVNGSAYVTIGGERYLAKDVVWYLVRGSWPRARLYHKNGDRADISFGNLTRSLTKKNTAPAADNVDYGIRITEFGHTVVEFGEEGPRALATYRDIDQALDRIKGAAACLTLTRKT